MIALALCALTAGAAIAAPYRPGDDNTVLERVPERSDLERLAPLRAAVAARPGDLTAALALATGYIEIGRRNSDPRFVAYAQATLLPWFTIWPLLLHTYSAGLFQEWLRAETVTRLYEGAGAGFYYLRILPWYAWPVWPLALWALWRAFGSGPVKPASCRAR